MKYIGNSIIRNGSIESSDDQSPIGDDNEVYEVLRIEKGHPLFIDDHLARWRNSMTAMGKELPKWTDSFASQISWLIICNGITDCDMRIVASPGGDIQCGYVETTYPTPEMYERGVDVGVLRAERENPELKIFHADMRVSAAKQQDVEGFYESLLVNRAGNVTEGSRSNVYFIDSDGRIHTAGDKDVLGGIMRKQILLICANLGLSVVSECVEESKVGDFVAAFLSSTPMRILPIRRVADCATFDVSNPVMRRLMNAMEDVVSAQIK